MLLLARIFIRSAADVRDKLPKLARGDVVPVAVWFPYSIISPMHMYIHNKSNLQYAWMLVVWVVVYQECCFDWNGLSMAQTMKVLAWQHFDWMIVIKKMVLLLLMIVVFV